MWDVEVGESGSVAIEDLLARLDWACCNNRLCEDRVGFNAEVCKAEGGRCPCGNGTLEGPAMGCVSDVLWATECVTDVTGVTVDVEGAMRGFQRLSIGNFRILEAWELGLESIEGG